MPPSQKTKTRQRTSQAIVVAPDSAPRTKDTPRTPRQAPSTGDRARSRARRELGGGGSSAPLVRSSSSGRRNTTTGNAIRRSRSFLSGAGQNAERVIAFELVIAEAVYIALSLYEGNPPAPKVIAALLAIYAILGIATIFGQKIGRLAYLFGALIIMGIIFRVDKLLVQPGNNAQLESIVTPQAGATLLSTAFTA